MRIIYDYNPCGSLPRRLKKHHGPPNPSECVHRALSGRFLRGSASAHTCRLHLTPFRVCSICPRNAVIYCQRTKHSQHTQCIQYRANSQQSRKKHPLLYAHRNQHNSTILHKPPVSKPRHKKKTTNRGSPPRFPATSLHDQRLHNHRKHKSCVHHMYVSHHTKHKRN